MPTARISETPELIIDAVTEKILLQNQSPQVMIVGFDEAMESYEVLDPWDSVTLGVTGKPIWVCAPLARNSYAWTLFWSPVIEEIPDVG